MVIFTFVLAQERGYIVFFIKQGQSQRLSTRDPEREPIFTNVKISKMNKSF